MIGAMWILGVLVLVGAVLYIYELRYRNRHRDCAAEGEVPDGHGTPDDGGATAENGSVSDPDGDGSECCGLHLVCEKDSLSPMSDEVVYYDDEELDRFIGRAPESYSAEEVEEFRDVLMTLRPQDVAGWARSVTQRRLPLPYEVRDELLILVNEQRANRD